MTLKVSRPWKIVGPKRLKLEKIVQLSFARIRCINSEGLRKKTILFLQYYKQELVSLGGKKISRVICLCTALKETFEKWKIAVFLSVLLHSTVWQQCIQSIQFRSSSRTMRDTETLVIQVWLTTSSWVEKWKLYYRPSLF